ncbi:molecular chaperone DnaJ [Haladaptatus halobius]|uniref:molecular chaperone DnaJ n=1 Tax=Haladaptatus halobius TaxID=2884875 RepID=UPI001D0A8E88|nr:molecular chaperone DnaJ [Haladaptatus halobius]
MSEDFYDVLGVSRDADEDEIKQAYRKKATQYHPDVSDDPDADEKFKKVKKAKEVLTDEEKRQAYDQLGHDRFEQAKKRGGFDGGAGGAAGGDPFGGGGGMGGMGDIFEQFFGGGGGRNANRPRQGSNLRTGLEIDLEDAFEGVKKQVTVRRPERCDACDGEGHPPGADVQTCPECRGQGQVTQVQQTPFGRVQQSRTCPRCQGDGQLYEERCGECGGDGVVHREAKLTVDIPAGIADGQTLQMEGEGAPGENGGPNGDLLIEVHVREHPDFERDGADLFYRTPVSFPQAVFGDDVEISTLEGTVEMDVPAGTQSGETFRLRGKGMPRLRRRGHGDLYVQVQVVTPESLNKEQREALEAFAEAGGEEVEVGQGFFERIKNSF